MSSIPRSRKTLFSIFIAVTRLPRRSRLSCSVAAGTFSGPEMGESLIWLCSLSADTRRRDIVRVQYRICEATSVHAALVGPRAGTGACHLWSSMVSDARVRRWWRPFGRASQPGSPAAGRFRAADHPAGRGAGAATEHSPNPAGFRSAPCDIFSTSACAFRPAGLWRFITRGCA